MNSATEITPARLLALRFNAKTQRHGTPKQIRSSQRGQYLSKARGRGMEFDDFRPYQSGDDIRHIDWRVSARTGTTQTKLFREERDQNVFFVVDQCAAMYFGTRRVFKSVAAAETACLLAWMASFRGDRVSGLIFNDQQTFSAPPRRGQPGVMALIQLLCRHQAHEQAIHHEGQWVNALSRVAKTAHTGSHIYLISDFANIHEEAEKDLSLIRQHNDVSLLQIYDPIEETLPAKTHYTFSDGLNNYQVDADSQVLQQFQQQQHQRYHWLESLCKRLGISYTRIATNDDVSQSLRRAQDPRNR